MLHLKLQFNLHPLKNFCFSTIYINIYTHAQSNKGFIMILLRTALVYFLWTMGFSLCFTVVKFSPSDYMYSRLHVMFYTNKNSWDVLFDLQVYEFLFSCQGIKQRIFPFAFAYFPWRLFYFYFSFSFSSFLLLLLFLFLFLLFVMCVLNNLFRL